MDQSLCQCRQCLRDRDEKVDLGGGFSMPLEATQMIVCSVCGNKRCPHATDHRHSCTNSNDPGQPGSCYA
jgi:hypothetical protein